MLIKSLHPESYFKILLNANSIPKELGALDFRRNYLSNWTEIGIVAKETCLLFYIYVAKRQDMFPRMAVIHSVILFFLSSVVCCGQCIILYSESSEHSCHKENV